MTNRTPSGENIPGRYAPDEYRGQAVLMRMQERRSQMLEELAALTDIESPSDSRDALATCARYLASLGISLLGFAPERIVADGRVHLLWKFGDTPRIVLVGHYDTVHPVGTVVDFPFSIDGDYVRGPGVCDMKGGVIIALHALRDLIETYGRDHLDGVCLFVNGDEEIGSATSDAAISELAKTAEYAIGFENAGPDGEIKTARRGCSQYEIHVRGRAAHAGDQAEKGINALQEMCAQFAPISALARPDAGTSVTPTMASAGVTINSVPELAEMIVDVRCTTRDEQVRVDREIRRLRPLVTDALVEVTCRIDKPPMPRSAAVELWESSRIVADEIGIDDLREIAVGGCADICTFAAAGVKTIDGFGAAGGDDHSDREWIHRDSLPRQAALSAALIARLLDRC